MGKVSSHCLRNCDNVNAKIERETMEKNLEQIIIEEQNKINFRNFPPQKIEKNDNDSGKLSNDPQVISTNNSNLDKFGSSIRRFQGKILP